MNDAYPSTLITAPVYSSEGADSFHGVINLGEFRSSRPPHSVACAFPWEGESLKSSVEAADALLPPPEDIPVAEDALDIWTDPKVPAFPFETLPGELTAYATLMARISGCDPTACAWAAIMSVQAVLDHRIRVRVTPHGNYLVAPNLWVAQIGDVSSRKSHPVGQAIERTAFLDRRDWKSFQDKLDGLDDESRKKAERDEGPRRRIVYDSTSEKICDLLSKQDHGITLVRDELSGWLGAMDKYGGSGKGAAQDRSIYLAGFDGRPYAQERIKGSRHIPNLCVGIYGGIQMAALRKQGSLDHDGLLQRFIPVLLRPAVPYEDIEGFEKAEIDFGEILSDLDEIGPRMLRFSPEAQAIYREIDTDSLDLMQSGVVVSEAFRGWAGKTPRRFAGLAVILHCLEAKISGGLVDLPISGEIARKAQTIVNRLVLPHGHRFYDTYAGGNSDHSSRIIAVADCLLRWTDFNTPISLRHIARHTAALKNPDLTIADRLEILDYFVVAGWLHPVERHFTNRSWWVVPGLGERFAKQRSSRNRWIVDIQRRFQKKGA